MSQDFRSYFDSLTGSWLLEREISTGEKLRGKAVFEVISDTAFLLCEEGELKLQNGLTIPAIKSWYWHLLEPAILNITYDEAGLEDYHRVSLKLNDYTRLGCAEHLCGGDVYLGDYRFSPNHFEISHTIKGPNKNYSVRSFYSK